MAMEYIEIPVSATRLRAVSETHREDKTHLSSDIRPATKILTSLPKPSPPSSPTSSKRRPSLLSSSINSLASPTISLLPQLLLSSTLPPLPPNPTASSSNATPTTGSSSTPQSSRKNDQSMTLLSSRDPLSIPTTTTNFKRFVTIIGPVFWLQDRMEEIILWKRGWMRTAVWMAAYAFLCFYPRLILLLPQVATIGIILASYPYPPSLSSSSDPLFCASDDTPSPSIPPTECPVPWQANIQGIQNLMGATADLFALIEPYTHHLHLHPSHLTSSPAAGHRRTNSNSSSSSTPYPVTRPPSPYTPHLLTLLVVSFPFLAFIISLPSFPIRGVCLMGGLLPFFLTHPWTRTVGVFVFQALIIRGLPIARKRIEELRWKLQSFHRDFTWKLWFGEAREKEQESEKRSSTIREGVSDMSPAISIKTFLQRVIDDDRLSDSCWNSEMREVELWENERFGGSDPVLHSTSSTGQSASIPASASASTFSFPVSSSASALPTAPQKGWSKQNLKNGERSAWTRGRDGWSPVAGSNASSIGGGSTGGQGSGGMVEGSGEISNLTFSLAPGWAFVETEDWRKDLGCGWSGCGGDMDGWVYTNDTWLGSRPMPYTSGGGSVTKRRRWVRRVWFDEERYKRDS
ncbi:hypothetical protein BYT27DRAFT_7169455 [Phlegmacium glaucopus]|nr:hypothetical protein BYT27DRAFT_7169455 [Phlegmacium glaucopus]